MKSLLTLFSAIMLIVTSSAYADKSDVTQQLTDTVNWFLAGASINDAQIHDKFWADELVYTSSNGTRFDKATLMQGVSESGPVNKAEPHAVYTAEDINVWHHKDMAIVTFTLVGTDNKADKTEVKRYLNSGTFVWRDQRWQAVNWQATVKQNK
ncbi:nuclear transport factor 2 family protein [Neptunicella marina]|uniref:Nuclear transport factor 2 family protein n=1 Tax=Neptunicella marina TaxID=2125989 RepID=A0A8J6IVV9_9ALTE|nr:nuclear transport factor 2 family protein [Neptunicella marina]MBC3766692.1 nuclear transport factor 2 family protein [Neptunicella marina]